jgi:hypothetical protein
LRRARELVEVGELRRPRKAMDGLLSLDVKHALSTISRRSFVAEMYMNHDSNPIIPQAEMTYSRDSNV